MWHHDPHPIEERLESGSVELPEWWGAWDYVALFIALFQSIAVPFLALALFFLLAAVAITLLGG